MGSLIKVVVLTTAMMLALTSISLVASTKAQDAMNDSWGHCNNINQEDGIGLADKCDKPIKVDKRVFKFINKSGMVVRYFIVPLQGGRYHYIYAGMT